MDIKEDHIMQGHSVQKRHSPIAVIYSLPPTLTLVPVQFLEKMAVPSLSLRIQNIKCIYFKGHLKGRVQIRTF